MGDGVGGGCRGTGIGVGTLSEVVFSARCGFVGGGKKKRGKKKRDARYGDILNAVFCAPFSFPQIREFAPFSLKTLAPPGKNFVLQTE